MLHPVWPSVYFWYFLGLCSSLLWLFPSMEMEFIKKSTPLVGVFVRLTILFSWFVGNTVLSIIFVSLIKNPRTDNFFRGYECVGKTVGCALVLFGNIGLYYYSEKSIACMLTFLFLGFYCLCTLFYIQPFTDFGVLDFFLSASLTQALHLFGLHIYSWLVFIAVMVIAGLRYQLVPELLSQPSRKVESSRVANADSEGEARDKMERDSELSSVVIDRHSERIVSGVPNFQNLKKLYLSGLKQKLNDNLLNFTLWNRPCLDVTGTTSESQALELLHQPPVASCLAEGDGPEFDHLHDYISPFSHSSWFFSLPDLSVYRTPNPFTSGDGTNRGIPVRGLTTSAWW